MRRQFRVFVVEDHADTARGLKAFLELAGYTVDIASNMKSAMQIAEHKTFDVLVCDLSLPDGTGWELMEALRKKSPVRGIVFSAFDEPEHVERSRAAGFEQHVVKGTTPEALLAAIDRIAEFELPEEAKGTAEAAPAGESEAPLKSRKRSAKSSRKTAGATARTRAR
ncbi:MAG: response regulator [Verrucomicrobiota bacterium]|nr:response regulator [Verrucomicrobiota bacterium]